MMPNKRIADEHPLQKRKLLFRFAKVYMSLGKTSWIIHRH